MSHPLYNEEQRGSGQLNQGLIRDFEFGEGGGGGGDPEETLSVYGLVSLAISLPHKREGSGECNVQLCNSGM